MAITDLTNTRWIFNNTPVYDEHCISQQSTEGYAYWRVNFYTSESKSSLNTYDLISAYCDRLESPTDNILTLVYESGAAMVTAFDGESNEWHGSSLKMINIMGGNDVTNSNLINWLYANATLVEANVRLTYNGVTLDTYSPHTINTSGKLMCDDVVIESIGSQEVEPVFYNISTETYSYSGAYLVSGTNSYYVKGITVIYNKSLIVNNSGTTNINGGNADKGVQVNGHTAIVDTYTVTSSNGDLLVPTYTASSKALSYPTTWTTAGSTATYPTLTGDVETINGLTIKDTTALKGSGTAPTDATYSYYLAKWNTASTLGTGSKVTISTSTPSGGANGDIWYQVL